MPVLSQGFKTTCLARHSEAAITDYEKIYSNLEKDENLPMLWKLYQSKFPYAANISFSDTLNSVISVMRAFNSDALLGAFDAGHDLNEYFDLNNPEHPNI